LSIHAEKNSLDQLCWSSWSPSLTSLDTLDWAGMLV